jgi:hypothetical protein
MPHAPSLPAVHTQVASGASGFVIATQVASSVPGPQSAPSTPGAHAPSTHAVEAQSDSSALRAQGVPSPEAPRPFWPMAWQRAGWPAGTPRAQQSAGAVV